MKLITILGPTACGKTKLTAHLAEKINGEIISADSRQVFRGMDIGTGKDYDDYEVNGKKIPYHLIDIADAGTEFSVYDFKVNFIDAYHKITENGKQPVLCGGTGLYLEAAIRKYDLRTAAANDELRKSLDNLTDEELIAQLKDLKSLHNTTDTVNRERLYRAIEIENAFTNDSKTLDWPVYQNIIVGLKCERELVRSRITARLKQRLENGMIQEVEKLLDNGVPAERLVSYGLEYKFITQYLQKKISYKEMFENLNIAIHQFSKRQMTWFRGMEKRGINIHWIEGIKPLELQMKEISDLINDLC